MLTSYFKDKDIVLPTHRDVQDIYYDILNRSGFSGQVYKELGIYKQGFRFDILTIKRWSREIKGFEIKVSRADFKADKKWQQYLNYAQRFSFIKSVSPSKSEIISLNDLPESVGLVDVVVLRKFGKKFAGYMEPEDLEFMEKNRAYANSFYANRFWEEQYPDMFRGYQLEIVDNYNVYYKYERKSSQMNEVGDEQYIRLLESLIYRDYVN